MEIKYFIQRMLYTDSAAHIYKLIVLNPVSCVKNNLILSHLKTSYQ